MKENQRDDIVTNKNMAGNKCQRKELSDLEKD